MISMTNKFVIKADVYQNIDVIWETYTDAKHVTQWSFASDDWHVTEGHAKFVEGGAFNYRMEAKDESFGFNFMGTYDEIVKHQTIKYHLTDKRNIDVEFKKHKGYVTIQLTVDAENEFSLEQQKVGWQAILDNFKSYAEGLLKLK